MTRTVTGMTQLLAQLDLPAAQGGGGSSGPGGMSVVVVLLVLLIGIGAGLWWFSKRNGLPMRGRNHGELRIREMKALGGRQFLVVGEYGKERFLLGVCPGRIDYLCPLLDEGGSGEGAEDGEQLAGRFGAMAERTGEVTEES